MYSLSVVTPNIAPNSTYSGLDPEKFLYKLTSRFCI